MFIVCKFRNQRKKWPAAAWQHKTKISIKSVGKKNQQHETRTIECSFYSYPKYEYSQGVTSVTLTFTFEAIRSLRKVCIRSK